MAQFSFLMDDDLMNEFTKIVEELGLTPTAAMNLFAKTVVREKRIPFEITLDPFYSQTNQKRLKESIDQLNSGEGGKHDLVEDDNSCIQNV